MCLCVCVYVFFLSVFKHNEIYFRSKYWNYCDSVRFPNHLSLTQLKLTDLRWAKNQQRKKRPTDKWRATKKAFSQNSRTTLIKESKMANQRNTLTFLYPNICLFSSSDTPHKIHYVGFKQCVTITILCLIKGHTRSVPWTHKTTSFLSLLNIFIIILRQLIFFLTVAFSPSTSSSSSWFSLFWRHLCVSSTSGRFNLWGCESIYYEKPNLLNSKF